MSIKVDPMGDSVCKCWSGSCEWTGTLIELTNMVNFLSQGKYDEAVALAEELERTDLKARLDAILDPDPEDEEEKIQDESMLGPFKGHVPRYALLPPPEGRGLTIEDCKRWELGYDEFRCRLVVPVRNIDGKLIGMMGRSIYYDQTPKWFAYWNFRKSNYFYGEHLVDTSLDRIIVVEGMPDVWRPYQFGYRNVIALLGSRLTFGQERKLLNWGLPVYWFLDGNEAGRKGTSQCVGLMRGKIKQYVLKCPEDNDPGSLETSDDMDAVFDAAEFVL